MALRSLNLQVQPLASARCYVGPPGRIVFQCRGIISWGRSSYKETFQVPTGHVRESLGEAFRRY